MRIFVSEVVPSDTVNPSLTETPAAAANAVMELIPGSVRYSNTGMGLINDITEPGECGEEVRVAKNAKNGKALLCCGCDLPCILFQALPYPCFIICHREIKYDWFTVGRNKILGNSPRNKDLICFFKEPVLHEG